MCGSHRSRLIILDYSTAHCTVHSRTIIYQNNRLDHLYVHVQTVVEIAEPEEVRESQRDVEGVQLFIAQRQLTQDVQVVLVPSAGGQRS